MNKKQNNCVTLFLFCLSTGRRKRLPAIGRLPSSVAFCFRWPVRQILHDRRNCWKRKKFDINTTSISRIFWETSNNQTQSRTNETIILSGRHFLLPFPSKKQTRTEKPNNWKTNIEKKKQHDNKKWDWDGWVHLTDPLPESEIDADGWWLIAITSAEIGLPVSRRHHEALGGGEGGW